MRLLVAVFLPLAVACGAKPTTGPVEPTLSALPSATSEAPIVKSTSCKAGWMTYLGFRGSGPPPQALLRAIRERFPDAVVGEVESGKLGVLTAEPHSMDVRARHEAAAATVGWKGDVVDFPSVTSDCTMTFNTPLPPPH
jgi:hypothetical protein